MTKRLRSCLQMRPEAAEHKRVFTEDQIKKHRQRYVVPGIEAYLRLHPPKSAPNSCRQAMTMD